MTVEVEFPGWDLDPGGVKVGGAILYLRHPYSLMAQSGRQTWVSEGVVFDPAESLGCDLGKGHTLLRLAID